MRFLSSCQSSAAQQWKLLLDEQHAVRRTKFAMSNVVDATEITVVEDKPSMEFEPVFTVSIKVMLSLVADLKKDMGGGVEESLGKAFEGKDFEVFRKGNKLYHNMRGLWLDLMSTQKEVASKLPSNLQTILGDRSDKRLVWKLSRLPSSSGVSHPVFASQVKSQVLKRRVTRGAEDTSNDPYGVARYRYSIPMNEDVDEKVLPGGRLRLLMHGHKDRYNKEHRKRFSQFRFHDKDPDNDKEEIRDEVQGNRLVSPDLEIGLMSMMLGERSVISIGKEKGDDSNARRYADVVFHEIVYQETGCSCCGYKTETGEKVYCESDEPTKPYVFMRNSCCGTPYSCAACPLLIRLCGFLISIISVFQIFIMEMCG